MNAYVHGYESFESERLRDQATTLAGLLHADTSYPAGCEVLEAGCGIGAQTVTLAQRSPGARFTSVDISSASIAEARRRLDQEAIGNVQLLQADILDLPFADASFDHLFICFVLEHLPRPVEALQRLRRLLRPGGSVTVIEGDHGSASIHPDHPAARQAIGALVELQRQAGGNALIGRQLYPLLTAAGFDAVSVSPRQVYVDESRPAWVDGFIRKTFTAMVASVREPALAAGLMTPESFDDGVSALLRTAESGGVFSYSFFKGTAVRAN